MLYLQNCYYIGIYIFNSIEEQFIFKSRILSVVYFGKPLKFRVTNITADSPGTQIYQPMDTDTSPTEDIVTDDVQEVYIHTDISTIEYYQMTCHTILKNTFLQ